MFGYHIIKLLEKIPPRKVEYEKVSADIKEALAQQELQKTLPAHFDKLKAEAGVQILDERYKLAAPQQGGSAASKS
jgi:parvulin-like peptidyl-prolyl isomerase